MCSRTSCTRYIFLKRTQRRLNAFPSVNISQSLMYKREEESEDIGATR